jgi:uncharacterized protein (TIGR02231 family)
MLMGLLVLSGALGAAATGEIKVPSRPSEVIVYPQGARVTRRGSAELPQGPVNVVFEGIPQEASEDTLRLSLEGPAGSKLYAIRLSETISPEAALQRRKELEKKVQDLEDQRSELQDKIGARQAEIDILKSLGTQSSSQSGTSRSGIAALAGEVAVVGKRLNELSSLNRKDAYSQREIGLKLEACKAELAQLGSGSRRQRVALAELDMAAAGTTRFELSYMISSASWGPVYDLRLKGAELGIGFTGEIRQQSGEDWDEVSVELSTAKPASLSEIPDPSNWFLDFFRAYYAPSAAPAARSKKSSARPSMALGMDSSVQADELAENQSVEIHQEAANVAESAYAMSFVVKRKVSLASGSASRRVGISESSHPVDILLVAVPRLDQAAYIQAEVAYAGKEPLIPGPAQLFREGEYVGKTTLRAVAPGEKFQLGFGKDEQVKVKRSLIDEKSSPGKGFLFVSGKRRYFWQCSLNNFHSSARAIEVREQLPRSMQKEIEVEALETSPKPQASDESKPGLIVWKLDLKPKEEQKIKLRYEVRFPAGQNVTGME